eukprot:4096008-Amphidinium_carterae.3
MRPIKHWLTIACAKYFAPSILDGNGVHLPKARLRPLLVQWLGEAIKSAERQSIVDYAWPWLYEEEQHMALAAAWEMQDAGTLWGNSLLEPAAETADEFDPIADSDEEEEEGRKAVDYLSEDEEEDHSGPASSSAAVAALEP